jgi:hypothetical protein
MNAIKYILNGQECQPTNRKEIQYTYDFQASKIRELELSVSDLRFVREDYTRILNWITQYGDAVGMPLDIQYQTKTIPYILDLTSHVKDENSITCKPLRLYGNDNFFELAEGLSFDIISWQNSDFRNVDYKIITEDKFSTLITLYISTYLLGKELIESVYKAQETISETLDASIPAGFLPALGAILKLAIMILARIAYTVAIIIALVKLATQILNILFPKTRQFLACEVRQLIKKGCEHLNFKLESTLLDEYKDLTLIPVPLREKDPNFFKELFAPNSLAYTNGHLSTRDTINNLGGLISFVESFFNAKTLVKDGVVKIETEQFFEQNATKVVPFAKNVQNEIQNSYTTNADELFKRLVMVYPTDSMDLNTFDDTSASVYEVSSENINSLGREYDLIKGLDRIDLPFARGTRKDELTFIEKIAKEFAKAIDLFTGGNAVSKIDNLKNIMQVSNQYFSVTKLVYLNGEQLSANQKSIIGADAIVNKFHKNRFIENNRKRIYENMPIALSESEIFEILDNNFVILDNGTLIEILNLSWSEEMHMASASYSVKIPSVNTKTVVVNGG